MNTRVVAALAITLVLWSSAFAAIRGALRAYDPGSLAVLRFATASLALGIFALISRMRLPDRKDVPMIFVCGLFGIAAYHLMLNIGEVTVEAGTSAFLINTTPIFTVLIARWVLKERLKLAGWLGIGLSLTGVLLIVKGRNTGFSFHADALYIIGAAFSSSIYIVLHKPYLKKYRAVEFMTYMIWAGTVALLPFTPHAVEQLRVADAQPTLLIVYLGVFPAALAYVTWTYLMAVMPVSRAVAMLYLVPPVATFFGWIFLGERPGPTALAGGVLALLGVIVVNRWGKVVEAKSLVSAGQTLDTTSVPAPAVQPQALK